MIYKNGMNINYYFKKGVNEYMTEKQKLFAETYLSNGFNAKDAYAVAFGAVNNKKPSYPYRLLKHPEIVEYIETRRNEIYNSLNIDAIRVMSEIADIAFEEKDGYNTSTKIKALELLSKNLGLQVQKVEAKDVIEVSLVED